MDYAELLTYPLDTTHFYGLIFLLGSLTVASLSDLRRMAAQQDFAEVWAAFTGIMFLYDTYLATTSNLPLLIFAAKWLLILAIAVATTTKIHFGISLMDISAIAALLACVNPAHIIAALVMLLILGELMNPLLKNFGEAGAYPYLPIVLTTTLLIILLHITGLFPPTATATNL